MAIDIKSITTRQERNKLIIADKRSGIVGSKGYGKTVEEQQPDLVRRILERAGLNQQQQPLEELPPQSINNEELTREIEQWRRENKQGYTQEQPTGAKGGLSGGIDKYVSIGVGFMVLSTVLSIFRK